MLADAGGSLWNIRPWEAAALPLLTVGLYVGDWMLLAALTPRARRNRALRRRQRRSDRQLAQRMRTW